MLEGHASPMECPIDEGGGHEHDSRVRQDEAPVRENLFGEVACHESRQPVGVFNAIHY